MNHYCFLAWIPSLDPVYVSFAQYDYFVHENESSVEVCLELFGINNDTLQDTVLLEFSTSDNTSIGEW